MRCNFLPGCLTLANRGMFLQQSHSSIKRSHIFQAMMVQEWSMLLGEGKSFNFIWTIFWFITEHFNAAVLPHVTGVSKVASTYKRSTQRQEWH